jgi:homocysteine S-methyltransferase
VFTARLDEWGADVIGLNCGVGPAIVLSAIEKMRAVTQKKLSAQPNAGLPRDVQGRQFYMCSPEYMAKYAKRIIQAGAKYIGGCCGTTPAHIKLISDAVRAASPRKQRVVIGAADASPVRVEELTPSDIKVIPPEERSHWSHKITNGVFVTSVEDSGFDPPVERRRRGRRQYSGRAARANAHERAGDRHPRRARDRHRGRFALLLPRPQSARHDV